MATHGLKRLWMSLKDDNQKLITGENGLTNDGWLFVDSSMLGTNKVELSNLEGTSSKLYGNDTLQATFYPRGAASAAITFNNLPLEIKMKAAGYTKRSTGGGWTYTGKKAHLGILVETTELMGNGLMYWGAPYGTISFSSHNLDSDTDSIQMTNDVGTFECLSADAYDGEMYAWYSSNDTGFSLDKVQQEVLGAKAAAAGSGS